MTDGAVPDATSSDVSVVAETHDDGTVVIRVAGALDLKTAPTLAAAVAAALESGAEDLLMDLGDVEFLGSAGLSVLVDTARQAKQNAQGLAVAAGGHAVLHALAVTGLDTVFAVYPDVAAAQAALRRS